MTKDEGIRYPVDTAKLTKLPLLKGEGHRLTAALASQITDGASAVLVVNERGLKVLLVWLLVLMMSFMVCHASVFFTAETWP